uniref:Amino acid transporter transmembrane domain-containing protein n=1 Tax=Globisporangium ultimum (strain ATCC 200006 / CBS 805.95 / DAOM BR144) TaxID=431595 RepID=K3WY88_GLOUD
MPASETSSLLGDYHRIGGVTTPRSSFSSGDATTPRSPFDTGFPMMFNSPIPSPRPHRLSFAYTKDDSHRGLHVFLTLLMSVVGAGMLSVPYTFILSATWQTITAILIVGFSMAFTATALLNTHVFLSQEVESVHHVGAGKRFSSFQSIAIIAGGNVFGYVVSVVTAIGIYGGCVGCIRIIRDISPFLISELYSAAIHPTEKLGTSTSFRAADYLLWATFIFVVFPLCLLKNLSGLRVSSYLGFAFSIYLVIAIIYRSYHALDVSDALDSNAIPASNATDVVANNNADVVNTVILGSPFARYTQTVSIYNYAFMMHLNLLPLFIQLRGSFGEPLQKSRQRMSSYIANVSVFCIFLYIVFGIFAKKLYQYTIRGNILLNLENDPVMEIPLIAVFVTVIVGFPLLFHPLRSVIEELIYTTSVNEIAFATRLGGTSVLLLSQLLIAIAVPGIEVVFAFTGASSCLMICFVFPAALYTQLFPWRTARGGKMWVFALWTIVAFFTVISAVATWFLLVDLRREKAA